MAQAARYFYVPVAPERDLVAQHVTDANRKALAEIVDAMGSHAWTREAIAVLLKDTAAKHKLKLPQLMMPLRVLVAGTTQTPAIDAVLALIARDEVRRRISAGLAGLR
jgi:glutamyl-tRNA synthetase